MTTTFNRMQLLKRRFFAMRNGAVADSLRHRGAPYRIIFGLNLPQIADIASEFGPDRELAMELNANTATRESMLIAPMLFPRDQLTADIATRWLLGAPTTEVIDFACLKLIKHVDSPLEVISRLESHGTSLSRYAAVRLGANVVPAHMDIIEELAQRELRRDDPMTANACRLLLDDIEWRREEEDRL